MTETTFATKLEAADAFRAKISSAFTAAMTGNPAGAATLRKMATSLKAVNDARMYRLAMANGGSDMIMKPLKVVLAAIARGDKDKVTVPGHEAFAGSRRCRRNDAGASPGERKGNGRTANGRSSTGADAVHSRLKPIRDGGERHSLPS
jgi:hypothetical protein